MAEDIVAMLNWHWFLPMLDEAEEAVAAVGRFAGARMTG